LGDRTQVSYPDLSTNQFPYDPTFHEPTVVVDGNGNRTTMTYDQTTGELLTVTDALNHTTAYVYYPAGGTYAGLVRTVTGPNGNVTSYGYDANRHVTTESDGYGSAVASTTTMLYDAAGNLLSETTGQSVTASYAHPSTTSYGYDPINRVNQQIDG
jgi:YD repeat-containing protein